MNQRCPQGFLLIETLVALAVGTFVIAAAAYFFLIHNGIYQGQKQRLAVEDNVRTAMDFVARLTKGATVLPPVTITGTNCSSVLSLPYAEGFGVSTGGNTANTLNDTAQTWTPQQWQGYTVVITSGTGGTQSAAIASNTANQLVMGSNWTVVPDITSVYKIVSYRQISLAGTTLQYQDISAGSIADTLSDHITCFTAQQDPTYGNQYNIKITAQTAAAEPDTGVVGTTTLQSSATVRN